MTRAAVAPRDRLCWPRTIWPIEDQNRWAFACTPKSPFEDGTGGELAEASPSTRTKYEKGWGRWLAFEAQHDPEAPDRSARRVAGKAQLQAYVDHLKACGNSWGTIHNRLQELAVMLPLMGYDVDQPALDRFLATSRSRVRPVRSKAHVRPATELVDLGFKLMANADTIRDLDDAIRFRDGLIIAFLALHPVRRRNLAAFELGINLIRQSHGYLVVFEETKTDVPYEAILADVLVEAMDTYLAKVRPALMARSGRWQAEVGAAVWVSSDGSPMSQEGLAGRIELRTKEAFGAAISPHRFRDAAATYLSIADPARVRLAAPLLGHRSLSTTEKHYIQAEGLQAQQSYLAVIGRRRSRE